MDFLRTDKKLPDYASKWAVTASFEGLTNAMYLHITRRYRL